MTIAREFSTNIFDPASHEDPTLLPIARQFVAEGNLAPFLAPLPELWIGQQQYRIVLDRTIAEHIFANTAFGVGVIDPRNAPIMAEMSQQYPNLSKLWDYNVFMLPEGSVHQSVRDLYSQVLSGMTPQKSLVQEEARLWAEQFSSLEGDSDLVETCCDLAGNVMLRILGLPKDNQVFFRYGRAMEFIADLGCPPERFAQADLAIKRMWEEYESLLADPGVRKDVARGLLHVMMTSSQFSGQDIVRMIVMLLVLSVANTAGVLYRLLLRLSATPDQLALFQQNPASYAAKAVNTGLHVDVAVWYILRHLGEEGAIVDGYTFAPWSHVVIMPYLIQHLKEDPVFDILKYGTTKVFSFGKPGTLHYCLGQ